VTQGLTIGSRVISRGYESLTDGGRIRVINEDTNLVAVNTPAGSASSAASANQPQQRLPHGE
jgi:hypothetical protein